MKQNLLAETAHQGRPPFRPGAKSAAPIQSNLLGRWERCKIARMRGHYLILAALALADAARADAGSISEPICTDRPGKGSATCAAPKFRWQVETGLAHWSLEHIAGERKTTLKLGEIAVKYGITDRSHIEVGFTPLVRKTRREGDDHERFGGHGDMHVKFKQELTGDGAAVEISLYPYVKLPTASKTIGNGKVEGGIIVPLAFSLGGSAFSVSAAPELDASADSDGRGYHPNMVQQIGLNFDATKQLSLSAELWGSWDWDPAGTSRQASLGGSASYKLTSEFQIDGGVDLGLNRNTPDVEVYCGMSIRF